MSVAERDMIRRVKFENFKALRDVEISFDERLTVLVGPNGSGKSSVLQGIHLLGRLVQDNGPATAFCGIYELKHLFSGSHGSQLVIEADHWTPEGSIRCRLATPAENGPIQVALGSRNV